MRNLVWDESDSFCDLITGFSKCRKDFKWQDRGIPILRELMVKNKVSFSVKTAEFGPQCQNLLIEDNRKDLEKNYPHICTLAMLVNEFFAQDKAAIHQEVPFDKFDAFREMGIPVPSSRQKGRFFRIGL